MYAMMSRPVTAALLQSALLLALLLVAALAPGAARAQDEAPADATLTAANGMGERGARLAYVELGGDVALSTSDVGPVGTSFIPGLYGGGVTAGRWIDPMFALELRGAYGRGESEGLFESGEAQHQRWSLGAGVRWGMPWAISPVVSAHLSYSEHHAAWEDHAAEARGEDVRRSLGLDGAAGVSAGSGAFTASLLACTRLNLASQRDRQLIDAGALGGQASVDYEDLGQAAFFEMLSLGLELRIGVRF